MILNGSVNLALQKTAFLSHESEYDWKEDSNNRHTNSSCCPMEFRQDENTPHKTFHSGNFCFFRLDDTSLCCLLNIVHHVSRFIQPVNNLVGLLDVNSV